MTYQRTCAIQRAEGDAPGALSGILTSDGEASDGHILNVDGAQFPARAPLLFGHDDFTGTSNLGSWKKFEKIDLNKGRAIRGEAQIEMGGSGPQQEWRNDINHMIDKKHIGQFSVRWDEISQPIRRVNLPSDHPAFVDMEKESGRKAWGYYFDTWRLVEGSVVTLGADPAALIGRMHESKGEVRSFWRDTINRALLEAEETESLVGVKMPDGTVAYTERAILNVMLEGANERLQIALDLHEEMHEETLQRALGAEPKKEEPKTEGQGGTNRSALDLDVSELEGYGSVEALIKGFTDALETSEGRLSAGVQQIMDRALGKA